MARTRTVRPSRAAMAAMGRALSAEWVEKQLATPTTAYVVRHNTPDAVAAYINIECGPTASLADAVALADALVGAGVARTARVVTRHDWDNALHVARAGL